MDRDSNMIGAVLREKHKNVARGDICIGYTTAVYFLSYDVYIPYQGANE